MRSQHLASDHHLLDLGRAVCDDPGRGADADEVAAVAFLAREDSRFITGQILSVNGGRMS